MLRRRRDAQRRQDNAVATARLATPEGRAETWRELTLACAKNTMIKLLKQALVLEGDVIECGVFHGGSLRKICKTVRDIPTNQPRTVLGLDTFTGFPPTSLSNMDTTLFRPLSSLQYKFRDCRVVPTELKQFAEAFQINLDLRPGPFAKTLPQLGTRQYCFVHMDCDTYASHLECLSALFDQIVPGGIIVYDDYGSTKWPGATKAIDEFLSKKPETVQRYCSQVGQSWYTIKLG